MKVGLALVALLLLVATPMAQATQTDVYTAKYGAGNAGAPNRYVQGGGIDNSALGAFTITVNSESYDTRMVSADWQLEISAHYLAAENTVGAHIYQVQVDGVNLAGCTWTVTTWNAGGLLATFLQQYTFNEACRLAAPAFGAHTVTVVHTTTGTPGALTNTNTVVRVFRQDYSALADTGILAVLNTHDGSEAARFAALTALLNTHDASELARLNAISLALTGFNATELQRAMEILAAIRDNSTLLNLTLAQISDNLTDHREHSIEVTNMNDFQGLGYDGFLFFIFWFIVTFVVFYLEMGKMVIAGSFLALLASVTDYDYSLAFAVVFFLLGLTFQYFREKHAEAEAKAGKETPQET